MTIRAKTVINGHYGGLGADLIQFSYSRSIREGISEKTQFETIGGQLGAYEPIGGYSGPVMVNQDPSG